MLKFFLIALAALRLIFRRVLSHRLRNYRCHSATRDPIRWLIQEGKALHQSTESFQPGLVVLRWGSVDEFVELIALLDKDPVFMNGGLFGLYAIQWQRH